MTSYENVRWFLNTSQHGNEVAKDNPPNIAAPERTLKPHTTKTNMGKPGENRPQESNQANG